jgi:hypothetical protein
MEREVKQMDATPELRLGVVQSWKQYKWGLPWLCRLHFFQLVKYCSEVERSKGLNQTQFWSICWSKRWARVQIIG